jgi:mannan endo-1,6-alpha-mannosidase
MQEQACEDINTCDTDQLSFKAYTSRWLAATTQLAPFTASTIQPLLKSSAMAAAQQCSGPNNECGFKWTQGAKWDGTTGVGQQMSALEVIQANLVTQAKSIVSNSTGGTSIGNPNAGSGSAESMADLMPEIPVTQTGRAAAGVLTVAIVSSVIGSTFLMMSEIGG